MQLSEIQSHKGKKLEYTDVEECPINWFDGCQDEKTPVSGPLVEEEIKNYAGSLGNTNSKGSGDRLKIIKSSDTTYGMCADGNFHGILLESNIKQTTEIWGGGVRRKTRSLLTHTHVSLTEFSLLLILRKR